MDEQTRIMEPYYKQIEAGDIPDFDLLISEYYRILEEMPLPSIKMACLTSLLITMYPAEFGESIKGEWNRRGFTTDLF